MTREEVLLAGAKLLLKMSYEYSSLSAEQGFDTPGPGAPVKKDSPTYQSWLEFLRLALEHEDCHDMLFTLANGGHMHVQLWANAVGDDLTARLMERDLKNDIAAATKGG